MNIDKDITEAIKKNLPQAVGDELQVVLAQAKKDSAAVEQLTDERNRFKVSCDSLNVKLASLQIVLDKHAALDAREAAVREEERLLRVKTLEIQLSASNDCTRFAREVCMGLVRNVEYRDRVLRTESTTTPIPPTPGTTWSPGSTTATDNSTVDRTGGPV